MVFYYMFSGWEKSAADSTMFHDTRITDLPIPPGRYYLADAGFPPCASLLIPFRVTHYHLQEWSRANLRYILIIFELLFTNAKLSRPKNANKLFNLHHASAHNVIE